MEHRLIFGGEQYLPFARSCIAKLKKAGVAYGSQTYLIGGISIRVRVEPGHEYIWLSGGEISLDMESGVVDLGAYIPANPSSFLPGVLHETVGVSGYNANFSEPVGTAWRTNPSASINGHLSGTISYRAERFRGKVPYAPIVARSFSPKHNKHEATETEPVTWVAETADENIQRKKITALLCPASVFTGKTRLYVQAMYGLPLYAGEHLDDDGNVTASGTLNYVPEIGPYVGGNIAPALRLASYAFKGEPAGPKVDLTTSSGVFLDPATGRHWLISVPAQESTTVEIYPLRSSAAGESLRKFLKGTGGAGLSTIDKEHLEAYILAYSLPDTTKKQTMSGLGLTVSTWSMGYGWHWNWSGTQADMVVQGKFTQPPVLGVHMEGMVATHYRVNVSVHDGIWSAGLTTVDGPIQWTCARGAWCITEPDFSNMLLWKILPKHTTLFACRAPFYAFYLRDELQLCTVQISKVTAALPTREVTPGYAGATPYSPIAAETTALSGGYCQDWTPNSDHWTIKITCGEMESATLDGEWGRSGFRHAVNNKEFTGVFGSDSATEASSYGTNVLPDGRTFFGYIAPADTGIVHADVLTLLTEETFGSNATVVVPPNDSQAIYMRTESVNQKWARGTKARVSTTGSYGWQWVRRYNAVGMPGYSSTSYLVFGPGTDSFNNHWGGEVLSSNPDYVEPLAITYSDRTSRLLCCAGVLDIEWGGTAQFHGQPEDEVIATFTTVSSAGGQSPAVIAKMRVVPAINASDSVDTPAFVGWA